MNLLGIESPHQENISSTLALLQSRPYDISGLATILDVPPIFVDRYVSLINSSGFTIEKNKQGGMELSCESDALLS